MTATGIDQVDPALVRAHGQLVALIAVLLQRAGVASISEFAGMLTVYAASIETAEPVEGAILSAWAEAVTELADGAPSH